MRRVDLHTHSSASDGSHAPAQLVSLAIQAGLSALALTDHDTTDGLAPFIETGERLGLEVVPGLEVSTDFCPGAMHILGYYVDPGDSGLQSMLRRLQRSRAQRGPQIADRLRMAGLELDYDEVLAEAGDAAVGKPHFAAVLVRTGNAKSMDEAFERFLRRGRPGYVEREKIGPARCIALIRVAGGIPVLAHPHYLETEDPGHLEKLVLDLVGHGLQGIEAFYPDHTLDEVERYKSLARRHRLLVTGGSDFHGDAKPEARLGVGPGGIHFSYELFEALKRAQPESILIA